LRFDAAGNLDGFIFGDDCGLTSCAVTVGLEDWFAEAYSGTTDFAYTRPSDTNLPETGTLTFALGCYNVAGQRVACPPPSGVPEPATLPLLGLALAAICVARRRKTA
jgi:hypothetical protein